jgi:hypothetical protein
MRGKPPVEIPCYGKRCPIGRISDVKKVIPHVDLVYQQGRMEMTEPRFGNQRDLGNPGPGDARVDNAQIGHGRSQDVGVTFSAY